MFEIGKKVVCIDTETGAPYGVILGKTYTITNIANCVCGCGTEVLYLTEVQPLEKRCLVSNINLGVDTGYASMRFKPLIESWVEELLEKIKSEVDIETNKGVIVKNKKEVVDGQQ
jgi:hypothetical protein